MYPSSTLFTIQYKQDTYIHTNIYIYIYIYLYILDRNSKEI